MICPKCGNDSDKSIKFCVECGSPMAGTGQESRADSVTEQATPQTSGSLVGYSERINDPAFARYMKQSKTWSFTFAAVLAVIAIAGFYIYGERSYEMDNPEALYIGLGIGGMFLLIALFQTIGRARVKGWDGVVIDKKIEKKTRERGSDDNTYRERYTLYTVVFKTDQGKTVGRSVENDDTRYNYYKIGDRVRLHKGLNTIEKYDKTGDTIIFCNACSSLNDINDEVCFRCSCPLLK